MKVNKGYTFAELILVVVLLSVLAAISIPRINFSITTAKGVQTTAGKITTDLRRTRRLAISDAAANSVGYELRNYSFQSTKSADDFATLLAFWR